MTPSGHAGKSRKLTVQKKGYWWIKVQGVAWTIGATGTYSWKHKPATQGSYRMQATIAVTATHTAATTPWRASKVK